MRLHPAVPLLLPYKAKNDVEICGYTIPHNTQLLVNAWAIARDPNYWNHPFSFCPERFLDSSLDFRGRDFEYIPFGAGRRICPGLPLAVRMVHLILASMIHSFDWKLPHGIHPQDLDMQEHWKNSHNAGFLDRFLINQFIFAFTSHTHPLVAILTEMELYIILFCISIFFLLLKPLFHRSKTLNLPPGPIGLPILGSIHSLGSHPNQSLAELAKVHGPIMTLRLGSITTIVLSSPEMAKQVLQTHAQSFSDRPIPDAIASMPNLETSLVWGPSDDNRWRKLRGICSTQLFSGQKLNSLQYLRYKKVEQLIQHIKKHCEISNTQVNIGQVVFATTLNLIFSTMFSIDIVDPEFSRAQELKDLVWKTVESAGKPNLSDYFPVLKRFDLQGVRKRARQHYDGMHQIFDDMIDKRMKARALDSTTRNGDFLDVLLDQWEENRSILNREAIKPLIQNLFIAGSETSATTTEWAMAELLRNPQVMQKAKKELLEVIGSERTVKESDIDELPYLQAVVKETLRLHPAAPLLLPYKARNDVEICGYTIPKGAHALVNIWAMNRDPKYWNQPLTYSPERFIGSKIDYKGGSFEFIPFGAGRRLCLGLPLATRMVHLMLASMILSFDWKLPKGTNPEDMDMQEHFGMTLKKAVPLYAIPVMKTFD
ncbi:hypothetical protein Gotri_008540 [Gossypium trilobum]|uniref:Cytochrome P450 n=1 Tax=Gossypium trilobum TaxID=34281 RepID=A0A7J9EJM5_9ROSI|nr:hypothetical protein [Gossypium trilobum]